MKCHDAVNAATGKVFNDAEIDDMLDRLADRAKRAKKAAPGVSDEAAIRQAAQELTREQVLGALTEKRAQMYAQRADLERRTRLDAMPDKLNESQKLRAYDLGSERQGFYTGASVDAEGRARAMGLWGQVEIGLEKMAGLKDRISNFWGLQEKGVDRLVAKEMARLNGDGSIEPTGDEGALHAAQVFNRALEMNRVAQNAAGAWIQKLEGYIARQSHDRIKVAGGFWREFGEIGARLKAGEGLKAIDWQAAQDTSSRRAFGEWRDFVQPKLDPRTFEGLEARDTPVTSAMLLHADTDEDLAELLKRRTAQEKTPQPGVGVLKDPDSLQERFLYRVWTDIVTGRHETLGGADDGDFRAQSSKAASVSKGRVLHFTSPDEWINYNSRYGTGSLFQTVMQQLERGARNTALMQRYGPNPETARAGEVERLAQVARARGSPDVAKALYGVHQSADFEALNGRMNTPENLRLAMIARGIRNWEAITKLGSIVLSKATDLPMSGHTMARAGAGFLKGYEGAFKGILHLQGEDAKRAAELLNVGARSFAGHLTGQFNAADGALGWGAWAARLMYRLNLFDHFNEAVRRGAAEMLSRHLGAESEFGWDGLQQGTRETMQRFGISPEAWETSRQGVATAGDGAKYFTLDHLERIADPELHSLAGLSGDAATPEAASRTRGDLDLKFRTMIHNIIDDTTSEPRLREQSMLAGARSGLKAGTIWGEAARSFGQFRGFLQTILGRHLGPAMQGYAGYQPVALMAHFIIASALAGYLSMNAKLIVKGQTPRPLVGADPEETAKIWAASMAQGGGLGIYGDYLFGEQNRNGLEFTLSSVAGPAIGDAEQVAQIVRQAVHGGAVNENTGQSRIGPELVRLGASNIPVVNLWYTRLLLDYTVLWRLQEAASPGYLQRYQNRVETEEGGHFLVPPTSAQ